MTKQPDRRPISEEELLQKMSELISLREKVAQAELATHSFGQPVENGGGNADKGRPAAFARRRQSRREG
jgi:hypothetical protein